MGRGGPLQRITHHIMVYSPTQSEKQKNREITHHMFHRINQKEKKHFTTSIQFFPLRLKGETVVLITEEGKSRLLLQCNTAGYRTREKGFPNKTLPRPGLQPSNNLSQPFAVPASANLVNSLPSPTIGKFHLSPLLCLSLPEALHSPQRFQTSQTFLPPPPFF